MTIRYDENGNPYDDGEYDYSQEAPQDEAPQQEFVSEGDSGGGGGGGDYNYEQDTVQEDPVFVVEDPVADPMVQEDPVFVVNDPMIDSSLVQDFGIPDPAVDAFKQDPSEPYVYEDTGDPYDPPKESDVYDEYPTTQGIIAEPIVAEPIVAEPIYADIRMGATSSPSSGATRSVSFQSEDPYRTPVRGPGAKTPIRNILFGKRRGLTQVEQPIEQIMEPFVAPEVEQLRFSPGTADTTDQVSMQIPVPVQKLDPLAPTSVGEYDYRPATIQGPPSELMRDPEFQPFDAAAVPPSDRNGRFLGRVRFTDENNKPVRGFPFGDNANQPAGQPLPEGGVFPLIKPPVENIEDQNFRLEQKQMRDVEKLDKKLQKDMNNLKGGPDFRPLIFPPVGGIGADVGNPLAFADVDPKELDLQERLRAERAKDAMRPVDPELLAEQAEEKAKFQAKDKIRKDRLRLIEDIEGEENFKRDKAIFENPNSSDVQKISARLRANEYLGKMEDRRRTEEQKAHDQAVQEKINRALRRFDKGAPLEEAKNDPPVPEVPRQLQPLGLGKSGSIYDTFKDFDAQKGEHTRKINQPAEVINRNESKNEELGSYNFIITDGNGMKPKMFPLASQVFDATVAEKNLNELKDMRYKELMAASPTGKLLESQIRQQGIAKLLDNKSLDRVIDFVNEVHGGVTVGNTSGFGTSTTTDINGKITTDIPGNTFRQSVGANFTNKGKNAGINDSTETTRGSQGPSKSASIGGGKSDTFKTDQGSSLSQTGGNSNKTSNAENRLARYNSMSKQQQEVIDSVLKASGSARADIEGKYNPAIEKYEEKYKQLKSETSEVGGRLLYLGDVTGAGPTYPKQAIDSTSKTAQMNLDQFIRRFETADPNLQGGLKDISVKHGLFNLGTVDKNMERGVDQLSNPAIADILDGKTHLPAISKMIQGQLPDVQYNAEKSMYDAEAQLRMEQTKNLDQNDPNFWAKYEGAIKSAATNSSFGRSVMAAKVLKAHNDLTQIFTNPSANPAENMLTDKRTLAPFDQYLDRLFNAAVMDPKANTVLGAVGMEMALRIGPYRQELAKIQNSKSRFTDKKNEATKYMIRALADPTNRDVYLQKVKELDPERYRGIGRPYAPVGTNPSGNAPRFNGQIKAFR